MNNINLVLIKEKKLSDKGGDNCDVLLMSATPIPRTLTMTIYGDMDLSIIKENPNQEKKLKLIVN
jgi:ATP-dependent DNA helicase RecG